MKNQIDSEEATTAPQDVANLYSWAGLDETKYRMFAASREEARAQARLRKGLVEAEVARQEFEEGEMLRRVADGVATTSGDEPPLHVEMQVGESATVDDLQQTMQEEPSSRGHLAESRAAVRRQSEVHRRFREQAVQTVTERERQAATQMGQQSNAGLRDGEGIQPRRQGAEPRWSALQEFFTPVAEDRGGGGWASVLRAPALAMVSLMGGVGKTSMIAALGRIFAGEDEHVLLLDANPYGVLPFYFGARSIRPGLVRSFSQGAGLPPIQVVSVDAEMGGEVEEGASGFAAALFGDTAGSMFPGVERILIDVATGSPAMTRRVLQLSPTVLVPLEPNMTSVVNLQAVERFLRMHGGDGKSAPRAHYILNEFDASMHLHCEVQDVLRHKLGDRLLPFVIRRSAAVNEALAEGMTVVDYAPDSAAVEDLRRLSAWVQRSEGRAAVSAPALRWREL